MIYFKDYPGFTCGSKSPDSRFLVWDSNFSEDFVYIILAMSVAYVGFPCLAYKLQLISKLQRIINFFIY